jgi:hypothetical protein
VRALIVIAASALLGLTAFMFHELRAERAQPVAAAAAPPAPSVETPAPLAPPPARPDARPRIRRAVDAIAPTLETPHDLDRYVDAMEQRARRERQLTAVEIEPGFEAIRRMRGQIGAERAMQLQAEYIQKLNRLSNDLALR